MSNGDIAAKMTDDRINNIQSIVRNADYASCPVPRQREVQEFQVDALACLIRGQKNGNGNGNGNGSKIKWGKFEATGSAATVLGRVAGLLLLIYIAFLLHGKDPLKIITSMSDPTVAEAAK